MFLIISYILFLPCPFIAIFSEDLHIAVFLNNSNISQNLLLQLHLILPHSSEEGYDSPFFIQRLINFCLKELQRKKENLPSICWSTPQMSTTARVGAAQRQEPGVSPDFPMWVQGFRVLSHPLLLSQSLVGSWIRCGTAKV